MLTPPSLAQGEQVLLSAQLVILQRKTILNNLQFIYIKFRLQINIFEFRINLGSLVQGELAALAV